ncbi:MAG: hypothetical protein ACI9AR_000538 [Flavobacteriaceae bacterium]|jgi:hypothetical protein
MVQGTHKRIFLIIIFAVLVGTAAYLNYANKTETVHEEKAELNTVENDEKNQILSRSEECKNPDSYNGIGVKFIFSKDNTRLDIYDVLENSPAEKAGVQENSSIISLDNVPFSEFENIDHVERLFRGEVGTILDMVLLKDRVESKFSITREFICPDTTLSDGGYKFIPLEERVCEEKEGFTCSSEKYHMRCPSGYSRCNIFSVDGTKDKFLIAGEKLFSRHNLEAPILGADIDTFSSFNKNNQEGFLAKLYKDKDQLWFIGYGAYDAPISNEFKNINIDNIEIILVNYITDGVYVYSHQGDILEDANSNTLTKLSHGYLSDGVNIYFYSHKIIGADVDTFEVVDTETTARYSRDRNNVYLNGFLQEGLKGESFEKINKYYYRDSDTLVYQGYHCEGSKAPVFIKNIDSFELFTENEWTAVGYTDTDVYIHGEKQENSDPSTLKLDESSDRGGLRDKNNTYKNTYRGGVMPPC